MVEVFFTMVSNCQFQFHFQFEFQFEIMLPKLFIFILIAAKKGNSKLIKYLSAKKLLFNELDDEGRTVLENGWLYKYLFSI